ncbi:type II CRISPR-associated endonuclease Cas1 [Arenibacter sp. ARW7G5Y1]|uniref:type II CRISPR-associated endonuclease Cas1 n=1 Tax=Arenibacter sp. ARW7G5Y1 TaxID=2135619 RepID=UPI000D75106A|nr:type II CRISPR-associated endonuclease Cas1 [Arenibacter sp. ARW7G5Y1]PXX26311.1 CRISPR-associated protein Cas1 [Arenibacter sp. ARW7G5Y1]
MIKRSILIEKKAKIICRNLQLFIETEERTATIPMEDIGFLVIDHPETFISIPALNHLIEKNTSIIICNKVHMPSGMFLNLDGHHIQQQLFKYQLEASVPLKKKLWQQTVKEKINNQGILLERMTQKKNQFDYLSSKVLSGDTSNMEGVAASAYWSSFFEQPFKRERFGNYPNNFLNYGYAILRAATARALSGSGLLNTLGIHHKNKYNAFALADDIMEPYRPLVDELVYTLIESYDIQELNTSIKSEMLNLLTRTVYFKSEKSPLMVGLQKTASSLQQCYTGERKKIKFPQLWN